MDGVKNLIDNLKSILDSLFLKCLSCINMNFKGKSNE